VPPFLYYFPHYFTDHLTVKYLLLNIFGINVGTFFPPELPNNGKNTMNIEIVAIRWRLFGEIFSNLRRLGENNRKIISSNYERLG
jgi:small basic protein